MRSSTAADLEEETGDLREGSTERGRPGRSGLMGSFFELGPSFLNPDDAALSLHFCPLPGAELPHALLHHKRELRQQIGKYIPTAGRHPPSEPKKLQNGSLCVHGSNVWRRQ